MKNDKASDGFPAARHYLVAAIQRIKRHGSHGTVLLLWKTEVGRQMTACDQDGKIPWRTVAGELFVEKQVHAFFMLLSGRSILSSFKGGI